MSTKMSIPVLFCSGQIELLSPENNNNANKSYFLINQLKNWNSFSGRL